MNTIFLASLIHLTCVVLGLEPEGSTTVGSYRLELYDGGGKSYQAAKAECESRDSWLVEIKDAEIDRAVQNITSSYHVWVGLFYDSGWKWNDGSQLRYEKWRNNRRPQIFGSSPKCGLRASSGFWSNYDCDSGRRYVCQSDISYPGPFFITITKSANINFQGAKAACESDGSRLVDVKTSVLSNFVLEKIRGDSSNYWTGGNDLRGSSVFKWGDGTVIDNNDNRWFKGEWHEPNNNMVEANCVAVSSTYMGWMDIRCRALARYICQKDVTTGTCDEDICSNRGTCQFANPRYKCTCTAKYFGTKCEKNLIQISAEEPTVTVKRGESLQAALNVISFDGNVRISHWVSGSRLGQKEVAIQRAGTSVKVPYLLGTQVEAKTYTFIAKPSTNIYSYSASTSVTVTVTSLCNTSLCSNGGTCEDKDEPPYYQCRCTGAYEGDHCEERKYLQRGNCKYHINYGPLKDFFNANSICKRLGGALVMIKSLDLQDDLEKQFILQYGNGRTVEIWVGGYKRNGVWYWMDGTRIPTNGLNQKWQQKTQERMIISSYSHTRDDMYWYSRPRYQNIAGYICEVPGSDPCTGVSCANGGRCDSVGCQANCDCEAGFDGARCEKDRIKIIPAQANYTLERGETVAVKLTIISNDGLVDVNMYKKGDNHRLGRKEGVSDGSLVTFTIGRSGDQTPETTYIFRATPQSSGGSYFKNASVYITVEGPLTVNISRFIIAIPTGSISKVECKGAGFPTPQLTWMKDQTEITTSTSAAVRQYTLNNTRYLHFSTNARSEVGYYTCNAENIVAGVKKVQNASLFVRGKLQLSGKTEAPADSSNEETNFSCSFEGYPDFDVYWKRKDDVKMHVILTNDTESLFEIRTTVDKTFPLARKTSTLSVRLAEYLGRTSVSCYAGNEYENISGENFAMNENIISRRSEWYRIYYSSHVRRYGDAEKHCQAEGGNLVKIVDPETQAILADGLTNRTVQENIFIGARRHIESNTLLWKWYDDTLLYNETKYGRASGSGTAGEEYVAWDGGEPNESDHDCAVMNRNRQWSWSDNECNHEHGFICQSPAAGIPRNRCLFVAINHKKANLTLTWKPAKEAIGVKHRIEIMRIAGTKVLVKSIDIIPKHTNATSLIFPNLDVDAAYNVTITVCPECPLQFATENVISTYMIATAKDPAATKFAIGGRACERLHAVDFHAMNTSQMNVSYTNDGISMEIIIIIVLGILLFLSFIINAILGLKLRKPQKASAPEVARPYETTYLAESPYRYDNDETTAQSNESRRENTANDSPHDDPSAYEVMESAIGGTDASGYEVPRRLENEPNNPYEEVKRSN